MGNWKYEGITREGQSESGTIKASSERDVRRLLRMKGIRPKRLTPPSWLEFDITEFMIEKGLLAPFGNKELGLFTKQLTIMIDAGIPIIQSLEVLYQQQKHPVLKQVIRNVATEVGEGKTIAESLSTKRGFSHLYVSLVKAGEAGGALDSILRKLSSHMDKQEKIKNQIKSALTYPAIIVVVGIGVIWGMMVFVVPQFVDMLASTGQEPPFVTKFVMDASEFLGKYSLYMVPVIVLFFFALNAWTKQPSGKLMYDRFIIKVPFLGKIVVKGNLASFARTLATMLGSGISLVEALDICIETIDNAMVSKDIAEVRKSVVEGKTLTEPLKKIDYFPGMVTQMINVGEQTGQIDGMLDKCADVFEEEVGLIIETSTKMVEPLIIVVLGGIVALILVAMYLPIFMTSGGGV